MNKILLFLVFVLCGAPAAQAATLTSVCESLLKWSVRGYTFSQYTIPLSLGGHSKAAHNALTLRRDVTWALSYRDQAHQGQTVFDDLAHAYPDSRVVQLAFEAKLYTASGELEIFPPGTILVLDNGLATRAIHRPEESEIEKLFIRFVRMHHHSLMGSKEYYEDDGRPWPINFEFLNFVTGRYQRLSGREFPTAQIHLSVVNGDRDPAVMKLLRKYGQIERQFAP